MRNVLIRNSINTMRETLGVSISSPHKVTDSRRRGRITAQAAHSSRGRLNELSIERHSATRCNELARLTRHQNSVTSNGWWFTHRERTESLQLIICITKRLPTNQLALESTKKGGSRQWSWRYPGRTPPIVTFSDQSMRIISFRGCHDNCVTVTSNPASMYPFV